MLVLYCGVFSHVSKDSVSVPVDVLLGELELGHASLDVAIFVNAWWTASLICMHVVTSLSGSRVNLLHMHIVCVHARVFFTIMLGIMLMWLVLRACSPSSQFNTVMNTIIV